MKITEIKWERYKRYKTRCRGNEMVYMITATETSLLNLETNNFIEDEFYMNQIAKMDFEELSDEE